MAVSIDKNCTFCGKPAEIERTSDDVWIDRCGELQDTDCNEEIVACRRCLLDVKYGHIRLKYTCKCGAEHDSMDWEMTDYE